jgi:hypothetical protein
MLLVLGLSKVGLLSCLGVKAKKYIHWQRGDALCTASAKRAYEIANVLQILDATSFYRMKFM